MATLLSPISKKGALVAGLSLIMVSGCTIKSRYIPVIIEGYWKTPISETSFKHISLEKLRKRAVYMHNSSPHGLLWAESNKHGVVINPYNLASSIYIYGGDKGQKGTIDSASSLYSFSCGPNTIITGQLTTVETVSFGGVSKTTGQARPIGLNAPSIFTIADKKSIDDCKLRYFFSYQTLGEHYSADVTIKFEKDTYIDWSDWHAPGMP